MEVAMPTSLPRRREPEAGRFRRFMANSPPWFQWTVLTAMFLAGLGTMILYFWLVKIAPETNGYLW
jgi:hypothetical protein